MEKEFQQDRVFLNIAKELSTLSKCRAFHMGAVIVKSGRIVSTGVNGSPSGYQNCSDRFDVFDVINDKEIRKQHHEWSINFEIHAEMASIIWAAKYGLAVNDATMYITNRPCMNCLKHIIAAGIQRIVYENEYDKGFNSNDPQVIKLLKQTSTEMIHFETSKSFDR